LALDDKPPTVPPNSFQAERILWARQPAEVVFAVQLIVLEDIRTPSRDIGLWPDFVVDRDDTAAHFAEFAEKLFDMMFISRRNRRMAGH